MAEIDWTKIREETLGDFTLAALPPTLQLPALPHAVTRFLERAKDRNADLKELSGIIETDTGLTIELLKFVNSAHVGLRHRANSVLQALTLLGARQSRMFVTTTGMQAAVRSRKSRLINQNCFWNASLQKALFSREVAKLLKADHELAFAGSLLQDYLLPVITNELFEHYVDFVQNRQELHACLTGFEREKFGWDHAVAGACLATRWRLPDELVVCILYHHYGLRILTHPQLARSAAAAVALSALLPDQLRQEIQGLEHLLKLQEKWNAFDLAEIAARVDDQHAELGVGVANDFPLLRRCKPVLKDQPDYNDGTLNVDLAVA